MPRPKKDVLEKTKGRVVYLNENQFDRLTVFANFYGMTLSQFLQNLSSWLESGKSLSSRYGMLAKLLNLDEVSAEKQEALAYKTRERERIIRKRIKIEQTPSNDSENEQELQSEFLFKEIKEIENE